MNRKDIVIRLLEKPSFARSLAEMIAEFTVVLDSAPAEFRGDVMLEVNDDGDDDHPRTQLTIYYVRPETDAEMTERRERNASMRETAKRIDIANARALLAKYGEQP